MSTVTQVQIVAPSQLAGTDALAVYVSPVNTTTKIGRAVFCNTTVGAVTITAGISTGGALTAATTLISALSIAPGATYVSPELAGLVIPAGSALRAFASAGASITMAVAGLTIV